MQYSQEHLKTMVYAEFGGQTECIMGNWKIENGEWSLAAVQWCSLEVCVAVNIFNNYMYMYTIPRYSSISKWHQPEYVHVHTVRKSHTGNVLV